MSGQAKVRVLYFASLREQLGMGEEALELPPAVRTLGELRAHLAARDARWQEALGGRLTLRMALNQVMAEGSAAVRAGDEVAFFPPVTGG